MMKGVLCVGVCTRCGLVDFDEESAFRCGAAHGAHFHTYVSSAAGYERETYIYVRHDAKLLLRTL